ncbi:MAG: arylsulfatase [Spirochaetaceae bacterium]
MSKKPNVVFVLTDDQGYGDLSCTGNPWLKTDNIDSFYNDSMIMNNFHVGPTCAPTRATLMTGHYANSTGVWHTVGGRSLLREDEVSIATAFKNGGYKTGIFGKWHLGDNAPYRPQDRGFDKAIVHGGGGISQAPDYWGNDYFDDTYMVNGEFKKFEGYCTDVWFREGINFIKENKENPFFCYIPTNAPHGPFNIMKKYRDLYKEKLDITDAKQRERFYGMITNLDENFGILRDTLKELELEDNTILIFMTDNGTSCGATFDDSGKLIDGWNNGLRGCKNSEYDGGHRVPFFLRWPNGGYDGGKNIDQLTASIDLMPTLLEMCGVEHGLTFHGKSIVPLLDGNSDKWTDRAVVTDSQRVTDPIKWRKSAVMTNRWRLINGLELYDMNNDRLQQNNLALDQPEVVISLREEYDKWWDLVKQKYDEEIPISIGFNSERVRLSSHDWRGDGDHAVWNQSQIRDGRITNSYWEINVKESGTYEIEMCRWPIEGNGRSIREGIDGDDIVWNKNDVDETKYDFYTGGKALNIIKASILIDDINKQSDVNDSDNSIKFRVEIKKGKTHLQTYFTTESGDSLGAYYTYVTKVL